MSHRWLVGVLALACGACAAPAPAPASSPDPGAAVAVTTASLPSVPAGLEIRAVSQGTLLAARAEGAMSMSSDAGTTWRPVTGWRPGWDVGLVGASQGAFASMDEGEGSTIEVLTADGQVSTRAVPPDVGVAALTGTHAIDTQGRVAALRDEVLRWRPVDFGAPDPGPEVRYGLNAAATLAVRSTLSVAGTGSSRLAVAPVDGSGPATQVTVSRLWSTVVERDAVRYLSGPSGRLSLCTLAVGGKPECRRLALTGRSFRLIQAGPALIVAPLEVGGDDQGREAEYRHTLPSLLVADGEVHRFDYPAGAHFAFPTNLDGTQPLLTMQTPVRYGTFLIEPGGHPRFLAANPATPATVTTLLLTTAGLSGLDNRPTDTARTLFARPVTEAGIEGDSIRDTDVITASASGGWTVAQRLDGEPLRVWDGARRMADVPLGSGESLGQLSGSRVLLRSLKRERDIVRDLSGRVIDSPRSVAALFGSLALEEHDGEYRVVDLDSHDPPVGTGLTIGEGLDDATLWGDWIVGRREVSEGGNAAVAYNYRTRRELERPGCEVLAVGDGYAVVARAGMNEVWRFADDSLQPLAPLLNPGISQEMVTDGVGGLAWWEPGVLKLARVAPGASAPRLLGVLSRWAPEGWTFDLDATRPLAAGTLVIAGAEGVVRTLPVPAAPTGSQHGVAWDGRDEKGNRPAAGDYTVTWQASAADGSGALVAANGTGPAAGTLHLG